MLEQTVEKLQQLHILRCNMATLISILHIQANYCLLQLVTLLTRACDPWPTPCPGLWRLVGSVVESIAREVLSVCM